MCCALCVCYYEPITKYFIQCSIPSNEVEDLTNILDSLQQNWDSVILMVASAEYGNIFLVNLLKH